MPRVLPDEFDQVVWRLDEASGPFRNSGALGPSAATDLAAINTVNTQRLGLVGNCIDFPGQENGLTKNSIIGASTFEPQPPITVSCWVLMRSYNSTGGDNVGQILRKAQDDTSWASPFSACGFATLGNGDGSWVTTITTTVNGILLGGNGTNNRLPLGIWSHLGLTYDGSTFKSYLNGNLVSTQSASGNLAYANHGSWFCGAIQNGSGTKQEPCMMIQDIRIANVIRPLEYFKDIHKISYSGNEELFAKRYYKMRVYDLGCPEPTQVVWVDTEVSLANAPVKPCGGAYSNIEILDTWFA